MSTPPAEPQNRLLAVVSLLVPAPLGWLLFRNSERPQVALGYTHAMGLSLLHLLGIALFWVIFFLLTVLLYIPRLDSLLPWSNTILPILGLVIVAAWGVLWLVALGLAALGSGRRMPVVTRLAKTPRRRGLTAAVTAVGYLFLLVVGAMTVHASHLTRPRSLRPARVYVLYDHHATTLGTTPRWLMGLGAYRIGLAARDRWGAGEVVVDRISPAALREAFWHGEVVILATHGKGGKVYYDRNKVFSASHLGRQIRRGPRLKLVYLTACGGGHALKGWRRGVHPAKVISFARKSSTSEHAWWFWLTAPGLL